MTTTVVDEQEREQGVGRRTQDERRWRALGIWALELGVQVGRVYEA